MIKIFLVFFLFLGLLVLLLGFSFIRFVKNMLFGSSKTTAGAQQQRRQSTDKQQQQRTAREEAAARSKKKLFQKDEGEYVDYEEVK